MKTKIMLKIENKRLKRRNFELETKIEKINKMYNDNLKSLHDELAVLLEALKIDYGMETEIDRVVVMDRWQTL